MFLNTNFYSSYAQHKVIGTVRLNDDDVYDQSFGESNDTEEITKIEALKLHIFQIRMQSKKKKKKKEQQNQNQQHLCISGVQYHQLQQQIQQHQQRRLTTTLATQSGQNEVNTQTSTNKASV